ncbi:MAG TPA: glycosyltransferase [Vicinamibacterales bacterium]|nr:glycosyltransferase [Vicinamibacterales bacterium]
MGSSTTNSQAEEIAAPARVTAQPSKSTPSGRPSVDGKFLRADGERLLIKGATYGTFAPGSDGHQFPRPEQVAGDFAMMAAHGVNTVRTYTVPPPFVLDEAARHGLYVMAGVPWAQHVAFLADDATRRRTVQHVVDDVKRIAGHPAVSLVALGNEIPAGVVRWHGRERIEEFLEHLFHDVKAASPETLFTYVNFPPTEFLDLPFFDVAAFNVYLHREADLRAYLTRLQNVAGGRPLLLAELGADSIRQGLEGQAALTSMQLEVAFRTGACGAIAFAWTDEWWRGGFEVEDWDFGLVDRARRAKPALAEVSRVFEEAPFAETERATWPKVSVVVCAYNAASTITECLTSLDALTYPNFEVIVVNDGSRDGTGELAARHSTIRLIEVPNGGLSAARNIGLAAATGDIVAYTDADVRVDPDWLTFLVQPFLNSDVVGAGGPNVVPLDDPWLAQCVARAPGGPTHVLLDDNTAEHVPGCNMAFRREALNDIGGFNPIYLRAGDDVDVCWRLQAKGWRLGFAPAALVWHRHRASIKAYWRQQRGYGEGEAWLAPHHPDKFPNGQAVWHGRIYSPLPFVRALSRAHVNSGTWGLAAFPSVYHREAYPFAFMPHKTGWMAASVALVVSGIVLALLGRSDLALMLAAAGVAGFLTTVAKCVHFALRSDVRQVQIPGRSPLMSRFVLRSTIAWLHFLQPIARAAGQVRGALAGVEPPPERESPRRPLTRAELQRALPLVLGRSVERHFWGELWTEPGAWLTAIVQRLRTARVGRGIDIDDGWQPARDVSVRIGRSGWLDVRTLIEDHGSGKRLGRVGLSLRLSAIGWLISGVIVTLLVVGALINPLTAWPAAIGMAAAVVVFARWVWMATHVIAAAKRAVRQGSAACGFHPVEPPPT